MTKKTPGLFRKPIPEKKFIKNIIKFIEIKADREYLFSVFELKDGFYTVKPGITKKDAARLKALAKAVKSNRAWSVRVLPLAAAIIIVSAVVTFCLFFMNPLLERALEQGLENLFEARAEVDNFHLNLLRFRVGVSGIRVADRDNPMTNLFQMGRAEIRLLPQAVLKGKVYIEEVSAAGIQFGTPRTVSGALPEHPAKDTKPKTKAPAPPPLIDLAQFDAMELVQREADSLNSKKLYEEAAALYTTAFETWNTRVADSKKQIAELQDAAKPFIEFNISSIDVRNPAAVQNVIKLVNDGKTALDRIKGTADLANGIAAGLQDDIKNIDALQKNAVNAVRADIDHLKTYIDFSSGTYDGIIDPVLRQILTGVAWQYINYGKRALEIFEKIKTFQAARQAEKKTEKKEVFKGRDVVFPSRQYPSFYMGTLASDFTIQGWNSAFDLRDVSSDPEITGRPVSLKLSVTETEGDRRFVSFTGKADFRDSAEELFEAGLGGGNFQFSAAAELDAVGISGFSGMAGMELKAAGDRDGGVYISGSAGIESPALLDPRGTVAQAIAQAVREASIIELGFEYTHPAESSGDVFSVSTNIGSLAAAALKKMVTEYANKAAAELERAVRSYIDSYAGEYLSNDDLDKLLAAARGDRDAIGGLQSLLQNKISEMENKVRGAAEEKAAAVVEQAKQKAGEAASNAAGKAGDAAKNALQGLFNRN
ncbi:MAG: hypothetical protein LBF83_01185 [Spirochaetaceae bacterium]|jgi:uncharacterized protein (TIGR03545 family)|nr:hypothetical protein [Spirochaetaceae bacterium]